MIQKGLNWFTLWINQHSITQTGVEYQSRPINLNYGIVRFKHGDPLVLRMPMVDFLFIDDPKRSELVYSMD